MPYKDPAKRLARAAARYQENPELFKARTAAYRAANPEVVKAIQKIHYEEHKAQRNGATKRRRWKASGWTPEMVLKAEQEQSHRCAICNEELPLVPDHKHSNPPVPRGLLCFNCNSGLGMFKDNPVLTERATQYLLRFS